jgi:hypothetical protein
MCCPVIEGRASNLDDRIFNGQHSDFKSQLPANWSWRPIAA